MDDAVNRLATREGAMDRVQITDITFDKIQRIRACEFLNSLQSFWAAVIEVVENHQLIPLLKQNKRGVAPNEASATSDQDAARHGVVIQKNLDSEGLVDIDVPLVRRALTFRNNIFD